MIIDRKQKIDIVNEADLIFVRKIGRSMAAEVGFGLTDQARIATAISELGRNIINYAGKGSITLSLISFDSRLAFEVLAQDQGRGIENIELALQDGFSTGGALGMGLPGTKRLMDEFQIDSEPGRGTVVMTRKWLWRKK